MLKGKEEKEINQILANKYKGYEDQIRRDVNDFIKFLLENKIIEE
ncbi:PqqD family peptide modification chaperone [Citroniella saccharovorans]